MKKTIMKVTALVLLILLTFSTSAFALDQKSDQADLLKKINGLSLIYTSFINEKAVEYENNSGLDQILNGNNGFQAGEISRNKFEFDEKFKSEKEVLGFKGYEANNQLIDASDFPTIENYVLDNVTVNGVPVIKIGIVKVIVSNTETKDYYYYLTETSYDETLEENENNRTTATILRDNEVFKVNYRLVEYDINYIVNVIDETDQIVSGLENDPVFGVNAVFGENRALTTTDQKYSFDIVIPNGYTGDVYLLREGNTEREELTTTESPSDSQKWQIGMEPVYVQNGDQVKADSSKGPEALKFNETFSNDNVDGNRTIIVEIKKKDTPVFAAYQWVNTGYARNRGTAAQGLDQVYPEDHVNKYNLIPLEHAKSWNWGYFKDKDYTEELTVSEDGTNTYEYVWTFQTNDASNSFFLDSLEINGTPLNIPLSPAKIYPGANTDFGERNEKADTIEEESQERSSAITILPDGTKVEIIYGGLFGDAQRHYQVRVTNALNNITITGGNLFQSRTGAPEYIVYTLTGIAGDKSDNQGPQIAVRMVNELAKDWVNYRLSKPVVDETKNSADKIGQINPLTDKFYGANVRFQLEAGYGDPSYLMTDINGNQIGNMKADEVIAFDSVNNFLLADGGLDPTKIYGPDEEGWYYIRLIGKDKKLGLLSIEAVPTEYVLHYIPGEVQDAQNMPNITNLSDLGLPSDYDDNHGLYYDIRTNNNVSIQSNVPVDLTTNGKVFSHWSLVGDEEYLTDSNIISYVFDPKTEEMDKTDSVFDIESNRLILKSDKEATAVLFGQAVQDDSKMISRISLVGLNQKTGSLRTEIYPQTLSYTDNTQEDNKSRNYTTITVKEDNRADDISWKLFVFDKNGELLEDEDYKDLLELTADMTSDQAVLTIKEGAVNEEKLMDATAVVSVVADGSYRLNQIMINPTEGKNEINVLTSPNAINLSDNSEVRLSVVKDSPEIDDEVVITPSQVKSLEDILDKAVKNDLITESGKNIKVIRLQAQWKDTPDPFSYDVYVNWNDGENTYSQLLKQVVTENKYNDGDSVLVGINLTAPAFVNWLVNNPQYYFSKDNVAVQSVYDEGRVEVNFVKSLGYLDLQKTVEGEMEDPDRAFTFKVKSENMEINDTFMALKYTDEETIEHSAESIVWLDFKDGEATVSLKNGEKIRMYLWPTLYSVTEIDYEGYSVTVDDYTREDSTTRVVEVENEQAPIEFINTPEEMMDQQVPSDILKKQVSVKLYQSVNGEAFTADPVEMVNNRVDYQLILTNNTAFSIKDLVLTDPLPSNMFVSETVSIVSDQPEAQDRIFQVSDDALEWGITELLPYEEIIVTFEAETDFNDEALFINHAFVTYQDEEADDQIEVFSLIGNDQEQSYKEHVNVEDSLNPEEREIFHSDLPVDENNYLYTADLVSILNQEMDSEVPDPTPEPDEDEVPDDEPVVDEVTGPVIRVNKEQSVSGIQEVSRTKDYIEFIPGAMLTYYITVTNTGDTTATNVVIADPFDGALTYMEGSESVGGSYDDNTVYWVIDKIEPGIENKVEVQFTTKLPEIVTEKIFIHNIAYVFYNENGDTPVLSNEVIVGDPPVVDDEDITLEPEDTVVDSEFEDVTAPSDQVVEDNKNNVTTQVTTTTTTTSSTTGTTSAPQTGVQALPVFVWIAVIIVAILFYGIYILKFKRQ